MTITMQEKLLSMWRLVVRAGKDEHSFPAPSKNVAMSIRFSLFNAIRPYRKGELFDSELLEACTLYTIIPVTGPEVTFRRNQVNEWLDTLDLPIPDQDFNELVKKLEGSSDA